MKSQRRKQAVRQAEAAEQQRLERERAEHKRLEPQTRVLEKLEGRRALANLLDAQDPSQKVPSEIIQASALRLIETLREFKIGSCLMDIHRGPTVIVYELSSSTVGHPAWTSGPTM